MVGQLVIGKDFRFFYHPPIGRIVTDMIELPTESQRPYAGQFVNLGSSYPTIHVPGYNIMFPQLRNTVNLFNLRHAVVEFRHIDVSVDNRKLGPVG